MRNSNASHVKDHFGLKRVKSWDKGLILESQRIFTWAEEMPQC